MAGFAYRLGVGAGGGEAVAAVPNQIISCLRVIRAKLVDCLKLQNLLVMFWFIAGVVINVIAILGVIGNAVYDALTLKYGGHNGMVNLIGVVLGIVVLIAFSLKNAGKLSTANVLLWVPGAPLLLFFVFFLIYMIIVMVSKPNWR